MTTVVCGGCSEEVAAESMRTTNVIKDTLCPRCYAAEMVSERYYALEDELARKEDEWGEALSAITTLQHRLDERKKHVEQLRQEYYAIQRKMDKFDWETEVPK